MRYVLDTHVLLWFAGGDKRIGIGTVELLSEDSAQLCVSMATLWELAIKQSLGKLELTGGYALWAEESVIKQPYEVITIEPEHLSHLSRLPWHHRDPFDRLIISQCLSGGMCLVTHDKMLADYAGLELHLI